VFAGGLRKRGVNRGVGAEPDQHPGDSQGQAGPEIDVTSPPILEKIPADFHRQGTDRKKSRPEVGANRVLDKGDQSRFKQIKRDVEDPEDDEDQDGKAGDDEHPAVPKVPRQGRLEVGLPVHINRQNPVHAGQLLPRGFEARLEVRQALLVHRRLLLEPLQVAGVMMKEKGPMVGLNLLNAGFLGNAGLILNKLEMNSRDDRPVAVLGGKLTHRPSSD
jgi:hypothetical protein